MYSCDPLVPQPNEPELITDIDTSLCLTVLRTPATFSEIIEQLNTLNITANQAYDYWILLAIGFDYVHDHIRAIASKSLWLWSLGPTTQQAR